MSEFAIEAAHHEPETELPDTSVHGEGHVMVVGVDDFPVPGSVRVWGDIAVVFGEVDSLQFTGFIGAIACGVGLAGGGREMAARRGNEREKGALIFVGRSYIICCIRPGSAFPHRAPDILCVVVICVLCGLSVLLLDMIKFLCCTSWV